MLKGPQTEYLVNSFSSTQQGMYFAQLKHPSIPFLNVGGYAKLKGGVQKDILTKAIVFQLRSIDILKSQSVSPLHGASVDTLPIIDFTDNSSNLKAEESCINWMQEDMKMSFELDNFFLRIVILKASESTWFWYVKAHHILFDAYSMALFFDKVSFIYNELCDGKNDAYNLKFESFSDFVKSEKDYRMSEIYVKDRLFWRSKFNQGVNSRLLDRCFKGTSGSQIGSSLRKEFVLTRKKFIEIQSFCKENGVNIIHYFIGILSKLNGVYGGRDFYLGLNIHNRESRKFKNTLGCFTKVIPIRIPTDNDEMFRILLKKIKQEVNECYRHKDFPLIDLFSELSIRESVYNVTFSYQRNLFRNAFRNIDSEIKFLSNGFQMEDLQFHLLEYSVNQDLVIALDFNKTTFCESIIEKLTSNLEFLIENQVMERAGSDIIIEEDLTFLKLKLNNTKMYYPSDKSILDLFEETVKKFPSKVAIHFGEKVISYRELDEISNKFGTYLIRGCACKEKHLIAISLGRSEDIIIAILAIWKISAAYLPINPDYPSERINYIINDSRCHFVINSNVFKKFRTEINDLRTESFEKRSTLTDLAYVIYTSGSSGNPKGVEVLHKSLLNLIHSLTFKIGISENDKIVAVTTHCFDISIVELVLPLTLGAKIIFLGRNYILHPIELIGILDSVEPTIFQATPSLLQLMIDLGWSGGYNLKVLCGGETLSKHLGLQLLGRVHELWNMYGPTETTIWSVIKRIRNEEDLISIGKPIANTKVFVLDEDSVLPIGASGEICIAGDGLARGYLNRVELTLEKFIYNSRLNERIYRTGDIGRFLPNGELEFLGRTDNQIKINGHRIELAEIENRLLELDGIREVAVIFKEITFKNKSIVTYFVATRVISTTELKNYLRKFLPDFMIPSCFIQIPKMYLSSNGKIDRKLLPDPSESNLIRGVEHISARNEVESSLIKMWEEILERKNIGVKDKFFDLGGHSVKTIHMVSKIQLVFGVSLKVSDVFEMETIEKLSEEIHTLLWVKSAEKSDELQSDCERLIF
jgi:amino acid adenylation domain-containing protein